MFSITISNKDDKFNACGNNPIPRQFVVKDSSLSKKKTNNPFVLPTTIIVGNYCKYNGCVVMQEMENVR